MTTEIAYLAGYIDGNGYLYMGITTPKNAISPTFEYSIQILSVDRDNLDNFIPYGGYICKKQKRPLQKTPYIWVLKNCLDFCMNITPYLLDKAEQAKYLSHLIKSIKSFNFQPYGSQTYNHRMNLINDSRKNKMSDLVTKELIESIKNRCASISPTPEDMAYLAGLIEAEGTFRIKSWKPASKPNKVYNTSLEIGNTRFPIFPWLMDRFGGNISYCHPKRNKRGVAIWSLQSSSLHHVLDQIYPFLRTRKKKACEILIEFQKTVLPNGGDRNSSEFNDRMKAVLKKREELCSEIHIVNKKGD